MLPGSFPRFDFSVEPSDAVVRKNEAAVLDCSAEVGSSGEGVDITWKRDGEVIHFPDSGNRR